MGGFLTDNFNIGFLADLKLLALVFALLVFFFLKYVLTLHVYVLLFILIVLYYTNQFYNRESSEKVYNMLNDRTNKPIKVCVVGTGFAGICMGVHLKKANIPFVMFEKSLDIGGTWWDNKYPGCACDVWTPIYQFSFCRNPNWSQFVAPAKEIQLYLKKVVLEFGLEKHIKLNTKILRAEWQEPSKSWCIETEDVDKTKLNFTHIVSGCGALRSPILPNIPGVDSFQGKSFHSQHWDSTYDYKGKRVAIIGSAASAVQIAPAIAEEVKELFIFQRTPNWHVKKVNPVYPQWLKSIFRHFPFVMRLMGIFIFNLLEFNRFLMFRTGWASSLLKVSFWIQINKSLKRSWIGFVQIYP